MNNKVLNKLIRDQMRYGEEYSYADIYQIYLDDVMDNDQLMKNKVLSAKTVRNYVGTWANDSVWLGRKYTKEGALFFKLEPPVNCPYLLLKQKLMEAVRKRWAR